MSKKIRDFKEIREAILRIKNKLPKDTGVASAADDAARAASELKYIKNARRNVDFR